MPTVAQSMDAACQTFLRLFTDRYTDLGPDYNPDLPCTLTDEEVEAFQHQVGHIIHHHGIPGISQLSERFLAEVDTFFNEDVIPDVTVRIEESHFPRVFSIFIRILEQVRFDLNMILPDFPGRDDLSFAVHEHAIQKVYSPFGDALIALVLNKLGQIRQSANVTSGNDTSHLIHIARNFHVLENEEARWKNPYFAKIREHTATYASGLDLDNTSFVNHAFQRVEREEALANSMNLGGLEGRKRARQALLQGFCDAYDQHTADVYDLSIIGLFKDDSEETQEKFQNLLRLYGGASGWEQTSGTMRNIIRSKGDQLINTLCVPSNNWSMDTLEPAVQQLAMHENRVYKRVRPDQNLGIPDLRRMLEREFKKIFKRMFRSDVGRKKPEEFLADFVEYIVSKPGNDEIEEWRTRNLEYMNVIVKHLRRMDIFIECLKRWIRIYEPEEAILRNTAFYNFLRMRNVTNYVSQQFLQTLFAGLSVSRVSFEHASRNKAMVLQKQCNTPLVGSWEGLEVDLMEDSKCYYTVALPNYCGNRLSVYMRMTGCQVELLNVMMIWGQLRVVDIYYHLVREDISGDFSMARDRIDTVLTSLISPQPLLLKEPDDFSFHANDVVYLNEAFLVKEPYLEVSAPIQGVVGMGTDVRYAVDCRICEYSETNPICNLGEMLQYVLQHVFVDLDVIRERLRILQDRGFMSRPPETPNMIHYIDP